MSTVRQIPGGVAHDDGSRTTLLIYSNWAEFLNIRPIGYFLDPDYNIVRIPGNFHANLPAWPCERIHGYALARIVWSRI